VRGKGIVGPTRNFIYAGADHESVSLLAVGDASMAELVARFYHARRARQGAAALRAAQVSM
jgi:CHAT domain-containing protein